LFGRCGGRATIDDHPAIDRATLTNIGEDTPVKKKIVKSKATKSKAAKSKTVKKGASKKK
jgi:hypothetical protein